MMNEQNMLEVRNLTKHFKVGSKQIVHAVDGVSFTLKKGKTLAWWENPAAGNQPVPGLLYGCTPLHRDRSF